MAGGSCCGVELSWLSSCPALNEGVAVKESSSLGLVWRSCRQWRLVLVVVATEEIGLW